MTSMEEWKRAVVHLEPRGSLDDYRRLLSAWHDGAEPRREDDRWTGTAFLVNDGPDQFLVSARHVLRGNEPTEPIREEDVWSHSAESDARHIATRIARVPSLDEFRLDADLELKDIGLPGAGVPDMHCYSYSDEQSDLAVISLNQRGRTDEFRLDIERAGYRPVDLTAALADALPAEGADVFTVGYPASTAVLGRSGRGSYWASDLISIPVFSFGRIAAVHPALPTFWCDLSAYPGNSGGPLVSDGKLIGIVTAQALVEGQRIPFARATFAGLLPQLIAAQREKDATNRDPMRRFRDMMEGDGS
jgi:Trypsin-like peptidase domain